MSSLRTGARLLETLTSALYAEPIVVFREYIQNAVDSFRKSKSGRNYNAHISINISEKYVMIEDNGDGIEENSFLETMKSISASPKDGDYSQIGFRGIGRLSGLTFCEKLWFINNVAGGGKFFTWDGEKYRSIISKSKGQESLENVIDEITETDDVSPTCNKFPYDSKSKFIVILENIKPELVDCILEGNTNSKKAVTQPREPEYSEEFKHSLELLLPIPYSEGFVKKNDINDQYHAAFGYDLSQNQFDIYLNGVQLFKPFNYDNKKDFQIIPIQIFPVDSTGKVSKNAQTIGILWLTFDYVFKAVKRDWGIAVRRKNMLVRGKSVLAEEASASQGAITTYNQYLSAIKGVSGELLIETDCLNDNSRRDWFEVDQNCLQLRTQLCSLMNKLHTYRYKMSHFVHNDNRTAEEKQGVIEAYTDLVSKQDPTPVANFIDGRISKEELRETDPQADERDILGYSLSQKRFYKEIMLDVYEYFGPGNSAEYYKLKTFILKKLNRTSNELVDEDTPQLETDHA